MTKTPTHKETEQILRILNLLARQSSDSLGNLKKECKADNHTATTPTKSGKRLTKENL
jgi:hypothetical protein